MKEKTISIDKIKAILSMLSMTILTIQHFVWIFTDDKNISYIPLVITFMTIFISSLDEEELKGIKWVALTAVILIGLSGCIIYTVISAGIVINVKFNEIYTKIMFGFIGMFCFILSILYIKRIRELE